MNKYKCNKCGQTANGNDLHHTQHMGNCQGTWIQQEDWAGQVACSPSALNDRVMPLPVDRQPDETPIIDRPVLAIVQHWHTKGKRFAVLRGVDETDHNWQTVDDDSELSHEWNVIAWDYLPELQKA